MSTLVELLKETNLTVSVAESLTAGMIGSKLAENEGISKYFKGGVICYCNEVKNKVLGVDKELLDTKGPYNYATTEQMAEGVLKLTGSDIAIAVSGVSGPGDDQGTKQGVVYTTIIVKKAIFNEVFNFNGYSRQGVREAVANAMITKLEDLVEAFRVMNKVLRGDEVKINVVQ